MCLSLLDIYYYLCQELFIQVWGPDTEKLGEEHHKLRFLCPWFCLRDPTEWYAGSDLCVYQQQILTPSPWASSTSPAFSAETLPVLIPSGHTSSESGREVVKQKEERDTLLWCRFVLLQEGKRQPSRQQKPQVMERALPTRREAIAPFTQGCGRLTAPFPPLDFYCSTGCRGGSKAPLQRARHPAAREAVQTALRSVSCAAVKQKSLGKLWGVAWCQPKDLERQEPNHLVPEACAYISMGYEQWSCSTFMRRKGQLADTQTT